jgi:hypothetical protein
MLKPRVPFRKAITDRQLLGSVVDHVNYLVWDILFLSALGEALSDDERAIFKQFTGRDREAGQRSDELIVVKGRRSGGSSASGKLLVPYLSGLCEHPSLVKGEKGVLLCIAPDQAQSAILLDYAAAAFEQSPILKQMVVGRTQDTLTLSNGVSIETRWSNFRRLRGPTYIAVICDESAFWFDADSGSANSDEEIVTAVRPGLASTGGPLIMISSPYARRGLLWETYDKHYGQKGDPRILVAQGASRAFNRTLPQAVVDRAIERDPAAASAEWLAQFRTDVEGFITLEAVKAVTTIGTYERPRQFGIRYQGFVDPAGGGSGGDSMTLAIGHYVPRQESVVVDAIREARSPFSPEQIVAEFADVLKSYGCLTCIGDKSALGWVSEQFARYGIQYLAKAEPKSRLYGSLLACINSRRVDLLDHKRLAQQLVGLERRTSRGSGHDIIDHAPGQHDDVCNAVAGIVAQLISKSRFDIFSMADMTPPADGKTAQQQTMEDWRRLRRNWYYQSGGTIRIGESGWG